MTLASGWLCPRSETILKMKKGCIFAGSFCPSAVRYKVIQGDAVPRYVQRRGVLSLDSRVSILLVLIGTD